MQVACRRADGRPIRDDVLALAAMSTRCIVASMFLSDTVSVKGVTKTVINLIKEPTRNLNYVLVIKI